MGPRHTYAALDLGTNNCRLLIARPERRPRRRDMDFLHVVDAFSRIVRLGEGLGRSGRISVRAMYNTMSRASTITAPTMAESRMASVRLALA